MQKEHGIVTQSYGTLTPLIRHPTGGPLKPILEEISARVSEKTGKTIDAATVLLLWARAQGVVVVTASGNAQRIQWLGEVARSPQWLTEEDIAKINDVGKTIHFRHYVSVSRVPR
jgi:diketogulonate reductase-like aldo/keto reductase